MVIRDNTSITPKMTAACRKILEHLAEHDQLRNRDENDSHARQQVGPAIRIFKRMGAVGAEETAAVRAKLFHRHNRRHRTAGNQLRIGIAGSRLCPLLLFRPLSLGQRRPMSSANRPPISKTLRCKHNGT